MIKLVKSKNTNSNYYGWILYTQAESERNRHYIEIYQNACKKYDMSIALGIYDPQLWDDLHIQLLMELLQQEQPIFVVNRTRDYRLSRILEELGVHVYNNSWITEIGNDKAKAYHYMEQHGIPIMPTVYETATTPVQYPVVVKSCAGHGGTEVFLLNDVSQWQDWKQNKYQKEIQYVVQQTASDLGRDVRVYVVGNRIAASVLRISSKDFRSNVCLGGEAQLYELNEAERTFVEKIISQFEIGMAGIDFVFHHGRMVFNEIEDMVGARMLYTLTDYDIVDAYVSYIWKDVTIRTS